MGFRLAKDLGIRDLPQETWEDLEDDGYLDDYMLKRDRKQYGIVLHRVQKPDARPGRPRGQRSGAKNQPKLNSIERLRAEVFSRELGRFASREPDVQKLRTSLFGGNILTHEQAEHLLLQVAPRYLPLDWFIKNHIPLLGHTSYFRNTSGVAGQSQKGPEILVEWSKGTRHLKNGRRLAKAPADRGPYLDLPQAPTSLFTSAGRADRSRRKHTNITVRSRGDLPESLRDSYAFRWSAVRVLEGSVFGEMQRVTSSLAESYHWSERESLLFLTEGNVPFVAPISLSFAAVHSSHHRRLTATVEFEPWVTEDSLANAMGHARRASLKKQPRLINERRLQLLDFVESYRHTAMGKSWEEMANDEIAFPWKEVCNLWTHAQPNWSYRTVSEFRATFNRTRKELLIPSLTPLWG